MDKTFIKITSIVAVIFALLAIFLYILVLINGKNFGTDLALRDKIMNPFINLTVIILIMALAGAIIFPFFNAFRSKRKLFRSFILLVVFVGLALLSYAISTNEFNVEQLQELDTTAVISRYVGAGLIFTYVIVALTLLSLLYAGISSFFKR